ncbi:YxeA family protein [Priestia megaterium]|uniref:YxeA family protein n=1 Tax=Priestia megaterium TaxID=1404 RepID=UPI003D03AAF9
MKFDKPIIIIGFPILIGIVLLLFYSSILGVKNNYYVQITESAHIINKDNHKYVYSLNGFNKDGRGKLLTFSVDEPYKKGTLVVVSRTNEGYIGDVHVIKENQLPSSIQKKFAVNNF